MLARAPRDRQRGNSLLLAMIVMSALATLGSLTVVSVQGSLKASTNDRSQTIAMYAAESGASVAMEFLRRKYDRDKFWSALVHQDNAPPIVPVSATSADILSNGVQPGEPDNLFSADLNAWYSVAIINNVDDPAFRADKPATVIPCPAGGCPACPGSDCDAQVIIQSTGHGPQGSLAIIEIEVRWSSAPPWIPGPPPGDLPPHPAPNASPVDPPPAPELPVGSRAPGLIILSWRVVL